MRIAVPDLVTNSYFPALAAVELGYFRAHGLDMELELISPIGRAMEALRDGDIELVAGPAHGALLAFPEWQGASLLAALSQHTYWLLVLRASLGIQPGDVSGVKGRRIGAAPGPDAALRCLLADAGIDLERDDVNLGPVPGASEPGVSFGVHAARALEEGVIDGFWANAMGAEVSVLSGIGVVVLDPRQGLGPPEAKDYTFPALVASDRLIADSPATAEAAILALVETQEALRADPSRASEVGSRLFPPDEAALIEDLIRRDIPFYSPVISPDSVAGLNRFARSVGLISGDAASGEIDFEQVVASRFSHLWAQ
ncbi:MAG: ABC transporter substrate-binding protein [Chloroflexi bacterium]|nr:ABC transporter substrate-binding protein [Chloroflexota bacterium]